MQRKLANFSDLLRALFLQISLTVAFHCLQVAIKKAPGVARDLCRMFIVNAGLPANVCRLPAGASILHQLHADRGNAICTAHHGCPG